MRPRESSDRPVLVEEIGYHSSAGAGSDEQSQASQFQAAFDVLGDGQSAGWVVWTAFDFVPAAGQAGGYEQHYGLWHADLTPKPALQTLAPYLADGP